MTSKKPTIIGESAMTGGAQPSVETAVTGTPQPDPDPRDAGKDPSTTDTSSVLAAKADAAAADRARAAKEEDRKAAALRELRAKRLAQVAALREEFLAQDGTPAVLRVVAGRSIQWPDGKVRGIGQRRTARHELVEGTKPYTVWADDPFIGKWATGNLEPADPGDPLPEPTSSWPVVHRNAALALEGWQVAEREKTVVELDRLANIAARLTVADLEELPRS
jgi:hypothetical protein